MSSHYNTEPPPTASATLHTTVGPIQISLFAKQTPLACKNFLQHCLDGYYTNTTFHRVVPGFVVQAGDPTGTGSGGSAIYDDAEFERDPRDPSQKIVFGDEIHSRLRFNRRGLVGMAKGEDGRYGSQFFVTLARAERELTGTCTMFGRVEGDGIYNIVKIAEAELVEGTERPIYAVKITGCEVDDLGPFEGQLRKRERVAVATKAPEDRKEGVKRKKKQAKTGKALLSFGAGEEEEEEAAPAPKSRRPKFNTRLVFDNGISEEIEKTEDSALANKHEVKEPILKSVERKMPSRDLELSNTPIPPPTPKSPRASRRLSRDVNTQLPLPDPESPRSASSSPDSSPRPSKASRLNEEIASLKASMRRTTQGKSNEPTKPKSALESLIPENSIRGRKRPTNGADMNGKAHDLESLKWFHNFKSRLEKADGHVPKKARRSTVKDASAPSKPPNTSQKADAEANNDDDEEEAQLCDLHFIANCQSCQAWDVPDGKPDQDDDDDNATDWMAHALRFTKDTLGKDQTWKQSHRDVDSLVVIDPRQKEKEIRQDMTGREAVGRDRKRAREAEWERKKEWARRETRS
ncbi:Peptidyl-prolyl isomerase cwc27 [Ophidiomyces ophidiicola]|uniref:Peptidyl-prolyl isomerase cwc27 n=1 Tax=Ophidiomyces ophidiicola TaxID=1387563 RepID=UPI0020C2C5CF|nr:Peptidyl-prolyl isomerase cwc27 [Ophidiomyces ophidiicola]KAI1952767.1 Peptidyl-prolyl isomerase cwc27 [Ophidiomyces ophidiicola]KAI2042871.1 Peptidyl-prolyl isomerase cwc27 [Ophidiomyces ophidiicola]KAI2079212.1 Peptidyl-prolyl isomerase cwc27 [Ophidiomyces ophidiicola]